ncbi:MAG: response regulator [Gammaproteobacteria bacterium]|nr:response regulator [Gammaproteobacteria bacterium]
MVNDEESITLYLQNLLQLHNYNVTYTTSSKYAVEIIKDSPAKFDLIITDQTMPELSRIELIQQVFQIRPDIPAILCSGYSETINMDSAIEMGCARYMEKPVKSKKLLSELQEILNND